MTVEQTRGRVLVSAAGIGVIFVALVWLQLGLMSGVGAPIAQEMFRVLMFAALFYFAHRGRNWARWILIVLLMLNGIGGVIVGATVHDLGWIRWVMVGSSLGYLAVAMLLAFSRDVRAFMRA